MQFETYFMSTRAKKKVQKICRKIGRHSLVAFYFTHSVCFQGSLLVHFIMFNQLQAETLRTLH